MTSQNDDTSTELYLVRIWKRQLADGPLGVHGKLQQVVSGASCSFEGLARLPDAFATLMEPEAASPGPDGRESPLS